MFSCILVIHTNCKASKLEMLVVVMSLKNDKLADTPRSAVVIQRQTHCPVTGR